VRWKLLVKNYMSLLIGLAGSLLLITTTLYKQHDSRFILISQSCSSRLSELLQRKPLTPGGRLTAGGNDERTSQPLKCGVDEEHSQICRPPPQVLVFAPASIWHMPKLPSCTTARKRMHVSFRAAVPPVNHKAVSVGQPSPGPDHSRPSCRPSFVRISR
jgi:hypothetical protein